MHEVHFIRLPKATPRDPRGPRTLDPAHGWDLCRAKWGAWLTHLPPKCRWMVDDSCPTNRPLQRQPTHPRHRTAQFTARRRQTPRREGEGQGFGGGGTRQPHCVCLLASPQSPMSDTNGSPHQDDRLHRRSPSRSPVSQALERETPVEREERRLAEAAALVPHPAAPEAPEQASSEAAIAAAGPRYATWGGHRGAWKGLRGRTRGHGVPAGSGTSIAAMSSRITPASPPRNNGPRAGCSLHRRSQRSPRQLRQAAATMTRQSGGECPDAPGPNPHGTTTGHQIPFIPRCSTYKM